MSRKAEERQKKQLALYYSDTEIEIGSTEDLPLPLKELLSIEEGSPYLEQKISGGLTGIIYKIKIQGRYYNLKRERKEILVKNPDGQTSFMNEIQIRKRVQDFKTHTDYQGEFENIVDTIYASKKAGIILSPWIEADHITTVTPGIIKSLFSTDLELEKQGIFDLDPCSGNLLVQKDRVILFDFGYTYLFDPLTDYNPDGTEFGLMHMAERFESRFFFQYLMDLEDEQGKAAALELYKEEKKIAKEIYLLKNQWLYEQGAEQRVLDYVQDFIDQWSTGLSSDTELDRMYGVESFLSYAMDAKDDLHGQTCTPGTLKKIDRILLALDSSYDTLKSKGLFWGEEAGMNAEEIKLLWQKNRENAEKWQIS